MEVTKAVVAVAGADKVGVRLSPVNPFNDMKDSNPQAIFNYVAEALNQFNLAYLHAVEGGIHGGGEADPFDFASFLLDLGVADAVLAEVVVEVGVDEHFLAREVDLGLDVRALGPFPELL